MPDFSYERQILSSPFDAVPASLFEDIENAGQSQQRLTPLVVGVDEAGCGPWAGPVVAGAVVFPSHHTLPAPLSGMLDDSKKLSEKKRLKAFKALTGCHHESLLFDYDANDYVHPQPELDRPWYWGIGIATVADIDSLNIRQAALLAMKRAVLCLPHKPAFALIDGIVKPDLDCPCLTIKKGDGQSYSIAAASILAKVYRDMMMKHMAESYPQYGWDHNAGYGTKQHQEALDHYGVTPYHRTTFKPIANRINAHKGDI